MADSNRMPHYKKWSVWRSERIGMDLDGEGFIRPMNGKNWILTLIELGAFGFEWIFLLICTSEQTKKNVLSSHRMMKLMVSIHNQYKQRKHYSHSLLTIGYADKLKKKMDFKRRI